MGMGFEPPAAHPDQSKSEHPQACEVHSVRDNRIKGQETVSFPLY